MPTKYKRKEFYQIPISDLEIKPGFNPRSNLGDLSDLKSQILDACGVLVTLYAWQERDAEGNTHNYISSGHRRYAAAKDLLAEGAQIPDTLPVQFEDKKSSEVELFCNAILTNTGEPLSVVDQAAAVTRLRKFGMSQKEIVQKFGKVFGSSVSTISNLETLDRGATPEVKAALDSGVINTTTAMEIVKKTKTVEGQKEELAEQKKQTIASVSNGEKTSNRRKRTKPDTIDGAIKRALKDETAKTKKEKSHDVPNDGRLRPFDVVARQLDLGKSNPANLEKNWIDGFKFALEFVMMQRDGLNESGQNDSGDVVAKFTI